MNKVDWYAYLDGSLSQEGKVAADQLLLTDLVAQSQLIEVKEFLASIRRQGLLEEVPLSRLQAMVPKRARASIIQLAWKPALAAGILVAAIGITRIDRRPTYETVAANSISEAASWIQDRNGIQLARLPNSIGRLVASERTPDSGCFCIQIDGKLVHLSFTRNEAQIQGLTAQNEPTGSYLSGKGMVAFRSNDLIWMVNGDDNGSVWKVAREAAKQLRA